MERRGFLKRLGIGAVSAPAIVKSISTPTTPKKPKIKPYKGVPIETANKGRNFISATIAFDYNHELFDRLP